MPMGENCKLIFSPKEHIPARVKSHALALGKQPSEVRTGAHAQTCAFVNCLDLTPLKALVALQVEEVRQHLVKDKVVDLALPQ